MRESLYYVWRRGDGYVAASYSSSGGPHSHGDKPINQFDVLLVTADWGKARDLIEAERDDAHRAVVASWGFK